VKIAKLGIKSIYSDSDISVSAFFATSALEVLRLCAI